MEDPTKLREVLQNFYRRHNPEKVDSVDFILQQYGGQHSRLIQELEKKYGVNFADYALRPDPALRSLGEMQRQNDVLAARLAEAAKDLSIGARKISELEMREEAARQESSNIREQLVAALSRAQNSEAHLSVLLASWGRGSHHAQNEPVAATWQVSNGASPQRAASSLIKSESERRARESELILRNLSCMLDDLKRSHKETNDRLETTQMRLKTCEENAALAQRQHLAETAKVEQMRIELDAKATENAELRASLEVARQTRRELETVLELERKAITEAFKSKMAVVSQRMSKVHQEFLVEEANCLALERKLAAREKESLMLEIDELGEVLLEERAKCTRLEKEAVHLRSELQKAASAIESTARD